MKKTAILLIGICWATAWMLTGCGGGSDGVGRINTAPVADAGVDQTVGTGAAVTLDGSSSIDIDNDLLTYSWTIVSMPGGSAAILSDSIASQPSFTADLDGDYVFELMVNDGSVDSNVDSVTITAYNATIVTENSFDDGTLQGWTADGLWHITDTQAGNGSYSVWYADPATGTFETFDPINTTTPTANAGSLTSPSITLGDNPTLDFDYQLINECEETRENFICDYDALSVEISTNDGVDFTPLAVLPQTVSGFKSHKVDLYGYAGLTVKIRFHFDTYDAIGNAYAGAVVDHIVVTDHVNLVIDPFPLTLAGNLDASIEALEVPLHFSFPFQGKGYSSTSMNINGYLDFGGSATENIASPTAFMGGLPRLAYLWNHLKPQDGGRVSYQRTATSIVFTLAGVNSSNGLPNDLVTTLNNDGSITIAYGPLGIGTDVALVGITPGGGLSDASETDLSGYPDQINTGLIFENFTGGGTDDVDLSNTILTFN